MKKHLPHPTRCTLLAASLLALVSIGADAFAQSNGVLPGPGATQTLTAPPATPGARGMVFARPNANARDLPIKKLESAVHVVVPVTTAEGQAWKCVKLTAAAQKLPSTYPGEAAAPATVGTDAENVLKIATTLVAERNHGWPRAHRLLVTPEVEGTMQDFASTGLAATIAMSSIVTGNPPEPMCAVIGAVDKDGNISAVGNVTARLIAAVDAGCKRIVVPEGNAGAVADLLLMFGPSAFSKVQIFAVRSLEEVPPLVAMTPDEAVARAMSGFEGVRDALNSDQPNADQILRDPMVQEALRDVLVDATLHLSARLLLGYSIGRISTLTLGGSIDAVQAKAPLVYGVLTAKTPVKIATLPADRVNAERESISAIRGKLDTRVQPCIDALKAYADGLHAFLSNPPRTQAAINELRTVLTNSARSFGEELHKLEALRANGARN